MQKLYFGLLLILIVSCGNRNETSIAILRGLDSTMEQSSHLVQNMTHQRIRSLQKKLDDPTTAEIAMRWLPKSIQVKNASDSLLDYLSSTKDQLQKHIDYNGNSNKNLKDAAAGFFAEGKKTDELFSRMALCKGFLMSVDTNINNEFTSFINAIPTNYKMLFAGQEAKDNDWGNMNNAEALLLLTKIKSQIINLEHAICEFCDKKVNDNSWHYGVSADALADKTRVGPGEYLNIYATTTGLWQKTAVDVTIDGQKLKSHYNSLTSYSFIVPQKEGMYSVPVEIKFINPYTNKITSVKKQIEYKVAIEKN